MEHPAPGCGPELFLSTYTLCFFSITESITGQLWGDLMVFLKKIIQRISWSTGLNTLQNYRINCNVCCYSWILDWCMKLCWTFSIVRRSDQFILIQQNKEQNERWRTLEQFLHASCHFRFYHWVSLFLCKSEPSS